MSENLCRNPSRAITAVDQHVGARMLYRRRTLRVSQEQLAKKLNVTFQQVQKYENATNRIAAGRLFDISKALEAPPAFFFEGLDGLATNEHVEDERLRLLSLAGAYELLTLYDGLSAEKRRLLRDCARAFSKEGIDDSPNLRR